MSERVTFRLACTKANKSQYSSKYGNHSEVAVVSIDENHSEVAVVSIDENHSGVAVVSIDENLCS